MSIARQSKDPCFAHKIELEFFAATRFGSPARKRNEGRVGIAQRRKRQIAQFDSAPPADHAQPLTILHDVQIWATAEAVDERSCHRHPVGTGVVRQAKARVVSRLEIRHGFLRVRVVRVGEQCSYAGQWRRLVGSDHCSPHPVRVLFSDRQAPGNVRSWPL